jgi:hypothetical protein
MDRVSDGAVGVEEEGEGEVRMARTGVPPVPTTGQTSNPLIQRGPTASAESPDLFDKPEA